MFDKILLTGDIKDKDGIFVAGTAVEVKNENFQTVYQAQSDTQG